MLNEKLDPNTRLTRLIMNIMKEIHIKGRNNENRRGICTEKYFLTTYSYIYFMYIIYNYLSKLRNIKI